MDSLFVSIAVCSKGRTGELRALATQLRAMIQTLKSIKIELVIVEDVFDAQDKQETSVINDADIHEVMESENTGFGAIRQRAVELAHGEFIVFIDDDCVPCDGWLEQLLEPFSDSKVVAVGGGILPQDGQTVAKATTLIGLPAGGLPRLLASNDKTYESDLLSTGNLALRRSAVCEVGGFDTRHRFGGEDQQLVGKLEGRKYFSPLALVKHRNRDSFAEVWSWFVRRGACEYQLNRLEGMTKLSAIFKPWHWSWSWRLLLFMIVAYTLGIMVVLLLLSLYYLALLFKILWFNKGVSNTTLVMESKLACMRVDALLIAPILRVWMDLAREAGRLKAWWSKS